MPAIASTSWRSVSFARWKTLRKRFCSFSEEMARQSESFHEIPSHMDPVLEHDSLAWRRLVSASSPALKSEFGSSSLQEGKQRLRMIIDARRPNVSFSKAPCTILVSIESGSRMDITSPIEEKLFSWPRRTFSSSFYRPTLPDFAADNSLESRGVFQKHSLLLHLKGEAEGISCHASVANGLSDTSRSQSPCCQESRMLRIVVACLLCAIQPQPGEHTHMEFGWTSSSQT